MTKDTTFEKAIHEALKDIVTILETAVSDSQEAANYLASGDQNIAIGTIIGMDETLERAIALYNAILAMHRFKK